MEGEKEIQKALDNIWDAVPGGKSFFKQAIWMMLRKKIPIGVIEMRFESAIEETIKELSRV